MADTHSLFAGAIPETYDRCLGPVIFAPYAADLARRVAASANNAVLETACGTGILTRELRVRLPAATRLVATDLNQPMIDHARRQLADVGPIEWQAADCTVLPFPDGSFNTLACQFGMMFVPDKAAAFREAHRVLAPGGQLVFNVWDDLAHNPYARVVQETINGFFPIDPTTFIADIPHGFGNPDLWADLLRANGFERTTLDWVALEAQSPTAEQVALGLVRGTPVSNQIAARSGDFDRIVQAAAAALVPLGGAAPFRSPMRALVITAVAG